MIDVDILKTKWLEKVSKKYIGADKTIIEKVIRALLLLEGLSQAELSFIFKGGTAVMLIMGVPKRFSIDIDIIMQEEDNIEDHFKKIVQEKGFSGFELHERETNSGIDKIHYKFFYTPAYKTNITEDNILLDILIEPSKYKNIQNIDISSPFVKQIDAPLQVSVPSIEDIIADKMTAFAPNTTGIPYVKSGRSKAMEIIKQLYDIGNLFDGIKDLDIVKDTFNKIAKIEMKHRSLEGPVSIVLDDIFQTALCLSTRGVVGKGDFPALQNGISQIKAFIYSEKYQIEKAIVHAARVAYLAKLIELKNKTIKRFTSPEEISDWLIDDRSFSKLNKLKKTNPEAFFYWYQVYLIGKIKK